jgi:hypothetical protein
MIPMSPYCRWLIRIGIVLVLAQQLAPPATRLAASHGLRTPWVDLTQDQLLGLEQWKPDSLFRSTFLTFMLAAPFAATYGTLRNHRWVRRLQVMACLFLLIGLSIELINMRRDPWWLDWILPLVTTVWFAVMAVRGSGAPEVVVSARLLIPVALAYAILILWIREPQWSGIEGRPLGLVGALLMGAGEALSLWANRPATATSSSP